MKVKLQPPSATELAPFNPILPPASITQIMLLANPTKVRHMNEVTTQNVVVVVVVVNGVHPHRRRCDCVTSWPSHSGTACATRWVKSTSSPRRRRGGAYSSVLACWCRDGTVHSCWEGVIIPETSLHSLIFANFLTRITAVSQKDKNVVLVFF